MLVGTAAHQEMTLHAQLSGDAGRASLSGSGLQEPGCRTW